VVRKAALALALVSAPSVAAMNDWWSLPADESGATWSVRVRDVNLGPGVHNVWLRGSWAPSASNRFVRQMLLYRVDCSGGRWGILQSTGYTSFNTTESWSAPRDTPQMEAPVPDSSGESLFAIICRAPLRK